MRRKAVFVRFCMRLGAYWSFQAAMVGYYTAYVISRGMAQGHGRAADCIACGQCESVCPQHLPIIELLKGAAARLDA